MTPLAVRRWRGLNALVRDGVEHGSRAVERVHVATARRPFAILELIPVVAVPARGVRLVHDAVVAVVYGAVRQVGRTVAATVDCGLELAERVGGREQDAAADPSAPGDGGPPASARPGAS